MSNLNQMPSGGGNLSGGGGVVGGGNASVGAGNTSGNTSVGGGNAPGGGSGGNAPSGGGGGGNAPAGGSGGSAPSGGSGGNAPSGGSGGGAPGGSGGNAPSGSGGSGGNAPSGGSGGNAPSAGSGGNTPSGGSGGNAPSGSGGNVPAGGSGGGDPGGSGGNAPGASRGKGQGQDQLSSNTGRTLVLCFDGTGNKFGKVSLVSRGIPLVRKDNLILRKVIQNSNVVRFMSALEKDETDKQPGIGTYTSRSYFTRTVGWLSSTIDAAFAPSLSGHVMDGYKFLMRNYRPGDRICLFGFSRGAYTARALSGMIYKVGLLLLDNIEQLEFAFQIYSSTDLETSMIAREFKKTFSFPVQTRFLGVWDTVASVGIIPQSLPYATQNDGVIFFRHALALDERRARFRPNLWGEPIAEREELDTVPQLNQIPMSNDAYVYHPPTTTDVREVWFAGAHADVGGGSHPTWYSTSLSRIPLRWMIRECFLTNTGILFNEDRLREYADLEIMDLKEASRKPVPIHNIPPNPFVMGRSWFRKVVISDDASDILSDVFDQLSIFLLWWIIEFLPLIWTFQKGDGSWSRWRRRNLGNGRYLPHRDEQILVHESVRDRILNRNANYWPKAINWNNIKDQVEWEK